ncbi:MAG: Mur ligase family protein [Planctomycetota bacterium]
MADPVDQDPALGVALDDLFPNTRKTGALGARVPACVTDWRAVRPGDAFVALDDGLHDGHADATRAIARGASAVVCEQQVPVFHRPVYVVPDSRAALGALCQALVGNPTRGLPTIGVGGTQGKTTTTALLQSIIDRSGGSAGVLNGLGSYDGMTHGRPVAAVPDPMELAAKLAAMESSGCTHGVAEISSPGLSQAAWSGIELSVACVTNITQAHLEVHQSVRNYRQAERRLLDLLSGDGLAVLNADDAESMRWISDYHGPALTYGIRNGAEVTAELFEQHSSEQYFVLTVGRESAAVRTGMVGTHHIYNCLAAATAALALGIDLHDIAAGIEAVDALPGRMQRVDCGQGFPVFVDSASTLDGVRASLRTAKQLAEGRVICVAGPEASGPGSKGAAFRQVLNKMSDLAILTSAGNRRIDIENRDSDSCMEVAADRGEAIAMAVTAAEPGDVVVIAGSASTPTGGFGEQADGEVETLRDLLYGRERTTLKLVA